MKQENLGKEGVIEEKGGSLVGHVNPKMLTWAREYYEIPVEEVAKELGVSPKTILNWESGIESEVTPLDIDTLREMGAYYGRAVVEFFLKEAPKKSNLTVDQNNFLSKAIGTRDLRYLENAYFWTLGKRENALDLYEELEEEFELNILPKSFFSSLDSDPAIVAHNVRSILGISFKDLPVSKEDSDNVLLDVLSRKLEKLDIMLLENPFLNRIKVRSIVACSMPNPQDLGKKGLDLEVKLPTIVLAEEEPSAQLFSLAYALGHVVLKETRVLGFPENNFFESDAIDSWCQQFALHLLRLKLFVPETELKTVISLNKEPLTKIKFGKLYSFLVEEAVYQDKITNHSGSEYLDQTIFYMKPLKATN